MEAELYQEELKPGILFQSIFSFSFLRYLDP